jgi:hypothetical protein
MARAPICLLGLALGVMAACAVDAPQTSEMQIDPVALAEAPASDEPETKLAPFPYWRRFYFVATPDKRDCGAPACGGYFVRMVNATTTPCWDGVSAPECYVAALDFGTSALPAASQDKILGALATTTDVAHATVVLRGTIGSSDRSEYADLHVDAAWVGGTGDAGSPRHSQRYYQIVDDAPGPVLRRLGVNEPDHAVSTFEPPAVGSIVTGYRDEELFDIDARFTRMR